MSRLPLIIWFLSIGIGGWLLYETGLFKLSSLSAQEESSQGIESLQNSLSEREKLLGQKEREIAQKEKAIREKELNLSQQIDSYQKQIKDLKAKIVAQNTGKDAEVEAFRKLYEKMDAKKVASLFDTMNPELVAEILAGMKPSVSVEVMSKMPTEKVKLLTEKYLIKRILSSKKQPEDQNGDENKRGGE